MCLCPVAVVCVSVSVCMSLCLPLCLSCVTVSFSLSDCLIVIMSVSMSPHFVLHLGKVYSFFLYDVAYIV